jgi:Fe2+ transport system protein B
MNDFINTEPYIEKTFTHNCRECGKSFTVNAQCHPKTGEPVTFISKYCRECNDNLRDAFSTVTTIKNNNIIGSAKIAQKNVEGLEETLQTLATSIVDARGEFRAFKKGAEYDIEQNTKNIKMNTDDIRINKLRLDRFEVLQSEIDREQSKFNNAILEQIKEIYKTLIIGFSIFVFFMLAIWGYLTYTHFKH